MTPIRTLLDRLSSQTEDSDIVFGLPLESNGKTIYPVFLDPRTRQANGAEPRQIGYMEISESRSDYTSLEPDNRPWMVLAAVLAVIVLTLWLIQAARGNQTSQSLR